MGWSQIKRWVVSVLCGLILIPTAYADETSFIIPIPKPHQAQSHHPLKNMTQDTMIYMVSMFINPAAGSIHILENPFSEEFDWGAVPKDSVVSVAQESFKQASLTNSPHTAFVIFRNLLTQGLYLESRELFHNRYPVYDDVHQLESNYNFKNWDKIVVELSQVKGTARLIYRSPKSLPKISIAQTQLPDGLIRETELIIAREDLSRQFDFYAYDENGLITNNSVFHSQKGKDVRAAVPYTCLTCHYDGNDRVFQTSPSSYDRARESGWPTLLETLNLPQMFQATESSPKGSLKLR
ncbi:MAG: hypothetical protein EBR01_00855 [Proteobacteria bacterium]|nr:hypothetical protein [Pseudomonadota bacterium]NBY19069.1 hypothetical protein [bacterium]